MYNAMRTVLQGREAELEKALNLDYAHTLLKVIGEDIARTGGGKDAEAKLERVIDSHLHNREEVDDSTARSSADWGVGSSHPTTTARGLLTGKQSSPS